MSCQTMTVTFTGSNQLQGIVAERGVIIEREDRRLTADKAVYSATSATNGLLELTGSPAWQAAGREGRGKLIVVAGEQQEMQVLGNASMKLPAAELGAFGTHATGTPRLNPAKTSTNGFAEITSEEYTLRPDHASFRGGVHVIHTNMNWACETLTAQLPAEGGSIDRLVAEQRVTFDGHDAQGQPARGTGDKAVYARELAGAATNETIRLTGNPARLETTDGVVRNGLIIWNLARNSISTPGPYSIHMLARNTNTVQMPTKLPRTRLVK